MTTTTTIQPPTTCPDCGHPTRITHVAACDTVIPGQWACTGCPAKLAWPPVPDYRCR